MNDQCHSRAMPFYGGEFQCVYLRDNRVNRLPGTNLPYRKDVRLSHRFGVIPLHRMSARRLFVRDNSVSVQGARVRLGRLGAIQFLPVKRVFCSYCPLKRILGATTRSANQSPAYLVPLRAVGGT